MKHNKLFFMSLLFLFYSCGTNSSSNTTSTSLSTSDSIESSYSQQTSSSNSSQINSSENNNISKESTESSAISSSSIIDDLTYNEKIDAYLDGGKIDDSRFINKIKEIGTSINDNIIENALYVSPNASSSGDGSINNPYTLQDGIDNVKKGQTIYLRGGTYDPKNADGYFLNCKGDASNYINIRNYPNEVATITNTAYGKEVYGIQVEANTEYVIFEGIEIANIKATCAYGIVFWGNNQNHIIIKNCNIHNIETTSKNENDSDAGANAILLFGEGINPINNVAILNNHCYSNITGWSETISVTANCEYVYVFENRVENNTNIGIDFYGNAKYCSSQELDQPRFCIASKNYISNSFCSYADCAGLYVDGARDIILQYNIIENCQYSIEIGSEEKNDAYPCKNILTRNNICSNNKVTGIRVGGYETSSTGVVKDAKIINNTFINNTLTEGKNSAEIIIAKVDSIEFTNNLIYKNNEGPLVKTDFNENYTKNIKFNNNLFYQENKNENLIIFEMFQKNQTGLSSFNNLLNSTAMFNCFSLDDNYVLENNSFAIDKGIYDIDSGNYDFYLHLRRNNSIDIGAVETY